MPKRSLSNVFDSDSESSKGYDPELVSDSDYASKKAISITSTSGRRKKKIQKLDASSSSVSQGITIGSLPHSKASHIIGTSVPIRLALLEWYKAVHDTRGMPWRKPYDPTQGPDERAQRAYEVGLLHEIMQRCRDYLNLNRFGFLRLCCNRLKLPR